MGSALISCLPFLLSSCEGKPSPLPKPNHPVETTQSFQLIMSTGGGFTGQYHGCTLASDGTVSHWQKVGAKDSILSTTTGSREKILTLRNQLEASGALSDLRTESGNMTTRLVYKSADSAYTWSWPGAIGNEAAPASLRDWYANADAYCRSFSLPLSPDGK